MSSGMSSESIETPVFIKTGKCLAIRTQVSALVLNVDLINPGADR